MIVNLSWSGWLASRSWSPLRKYEGGIIPFAALPSSFCFRLRFLWRDKPARPALYLGSSHCARPLPRGFTGHVAHPSRSIHPTFGVASK
jgi:hypothetical protein